MKPNLSIIILAAGKGTRMKSQTAKILHSLCGKPMIAHIIEESLKLSDDISVVVAHQSEDVIEYVNSQFKNIKFITQDLENFPGTGGALKNVTCSSKKVLVLNGDMPLVKAEELEKFLGFESDIVMSIFNLEEPTGYGRVKIENGDVQYIVEQKDASDEELQIQSVNAGIYCFTQEILETFIPLLSNNNAQHEYYLTDVVALAKDSGKKISPLEVSQESFKGVNSKKDLSDCEVIMLDRIKTHWMAQGVKMELPSTIYIEKDVVFEDECVVEQGVKITGKTHIKASHVKAHSIVEDSFVSHSDVGPLAHLRPNSNITSTHIGNFVEVKKSTLKGVKAGHLSYIGDSIVDEGTNIGAGVITCNYDGKKKYQTIIGKNVFVGSDSQLIAPINIEDDVIVAAGSTLTKNVKEGSLVLTRAPLKVLEGYFYKFFGIKK
ncbi:MAG: bifunctional UDP-N-acetylglucosamine diphosphorylase/glucosamine-1-phosphate N-acetyltransferase GlmU [Campylobacterota bacterium]|nr:bifunctional UDP-N-acetylglucosamine diphosphorylase/glucosamine-1-phosphate N-acetyltransferase GlmU [Campylobacterota bacterium]